MNDYLIKEKPSKLLIKFAIPCILSLLISALYNIVDQIFIGNSSEGSLGNTATSIVFPLTCIALAFGLMLGDGAASYMSLCLGRKDDKKISNIVGTVISVGIIISALFLLISFPLLSNILSFFGAKTPESLDKSYQYGFVILIGVPFYILMNAINSIIRADGSPKVAMISMVTGAIINVILDAIFILALNMGVFGAALATIIGQIASFLISIFYLAFMTKTFKLKLKDFKISISSLLNVSKLGVSSFLTQIAIVIISVVSMNMLAVYGAQSKYGINDPQAIIGVVMKVFTIVVNIAVGIAAGAQPIVGYNYGAGQIKRVKELLKLVLSSTFVVGVIATILFELIPGQILSIFGSNSSNPENYLEFGILAMRIYLGGIIFTLIQKVTSIFLQAIDRPIKATLLSLIRDVVAMVIFTTTLPLGMGIMGVLWAAPISDVFGIIFSVIFLVIEIRKLNKMNDQKENLYGQDNELELSNN